MNGMDVLGRNDRATLDLEMSGRNHINSFLSVGMRSLFSASYL